jgi:hypothetical protein
MTLKAQFETESVATSFKNWPVASYPQNIQGTNQAQLFQTERGQRLTRPGDERIRRPVSRVLCRPRKADAAIIPLDRPSPDGSRDQPGRLGRRGLSDLRVRRADAAPLFGLAPGGACHAVPVARSAVGSYPTLSPLPQRGGLLSVALSLGSRPAGVTRRHFAVEPGLSSLSAQRRERPPGRLIQDQG